MAFDFRQKFRG